MGWRVESERDWESTRNGASAAQVTGEGEEDRRGLPKETAVEGKGKGRGDGTGGAPPLLLLAFPFRCRRSGDWHRRVD